MTPEMDDGTPCPVNGCTDTLVNCLRRADLMWPDDPHTEQTDGATA